MGHHGRWFHRPRQYGRGPRPEPRFWREGAELAELIFDACRGEVVITMLADDEAVEGAVAGEGGIAQCLAAQRIHVSMSTISVALSERLSQMHQERDQKYIAAPVFGRPEAAAAKLFITAAGSADAIKICEPLFDAIGQKTFIVSENPADANLVKLCGNFLLAATIESSIALVRKVGSTPIARAR